MAVEKMAPFSQGHLFAMEKSEEIMMFYTDSISQPYGDEMRPQLQMKN